MPDSLLAMALYPAALVVAGLWDCVSRTIPNWLVGGLAMSFVLLATIGGLDPSRIAAHLAAAALALTLGFACFAAGWLGGGDGKLMAATALWLGPSATPIYLAHSALAGGILAIIVLVFRALPLPAGLAGAAWASALRQPNAPLPYGVALAAGGISAMPASFIS